LLPSRVLAEADTLDFLVMDVVLAYNKYQQEREENKRKGLPPTAPALSINKMQEMIERVRR
jgi:hypothetical protein